MQFSIGTDRILVNMADLAQLQAEVLTRLTAGQGFALATLNLDHLAKLTGSPEFRAAYTAHDLITADGNPIVWMGGIAGQKLALLPGSDLILPLSRLAAQALVPVGLVGSTDSSLAQAALALQTAVPGLHIVVQIAPPMGFDPASAAADGVLDQLDKAGVRLCFLALGAPKQEIFAANGRLRAPRIGFVSIGAGLDFLSGSQTRAPLWVRRLALEWVWRMLSDPRRMAGRYLQAALVLPGHMWRSWGQR